MNSSFLSIGIPARNEEYSIAPTINAILASSVWKKMPNSQKELIICVNGSTDGTPRIASLIAEQINLSAQSQLVKVIHIKESGKNNAINIIAKAANEKANIIYFSDADVIPMEDAIEKVITALEKEKNYEFATAHLTSEATQKPVHQRTFLESFFAENEELLERNSWTWLRGAGFSVRRDFLLRNPLPKNPRISDDRFINRKFAGKILVVKDAIVLHRPPNFVDYTRQKMRHFYDKRAMKKQVDVKPQKHEKKSTVAKRDLANALRMSHKAKIGFGLHLLATIGGFTASLRPRKDTWPTTKSTKLKRK